MIFSGYVSFREGKSNGKVLKRYGLVMKHQFWEDMVEPFWRNSNYSSEIIQAHHAHIIRMVPVLNPWSLWLQAQEGVRHTSLLCCVSQSSTKISVWSEYSTTVRPLIKSQDNAKSNNHRVETVVPLTGSIIPRVDLRHIWLDGGHRGLAKPKGTSITHVGGVWVSCCFVASQPSTV